MNKFYFIVLLLISLSASSQINNTELNTNNFLFTIKNTSYQISGDSIYRDTEISKRIGTKHNLDINDYLIYLVSLFVYLQISFQLYSYLF